MSNAVKCPATRIAEVIRFRENSCANGPRVYRKDRASKSEAECSGSALLRSCDSRSLRCRSGAARSELKGPLHGVPITIKDNLDTAGIISAGGTKGRKDRRGDATVVTRLRGAGAILLGKSNTPGADYGV